MRGAGGRHRRLDAACVERLLTPGLGQRPDAQRGPRVAGGVPLRRRPPSCAPRRLRGSSFQHAHDELRELRDVRCPGTCCSAPLSVRFHDAPHGPRMGHHLLEARGACTKRPL